MRNIQLILSQLHQKMLKMFSLPIKSGVILNAYTHVHTYIYPQCKRVHFVKVPGAHTLMIHPQAHANRPLSGRKILVMEEIDIKMKMSNRCMVAIVSRNHGTIAHRHAQPGPSFYQYSQTCIANWTDICVRQFARQLRPNRTTKRQKLSCKLLLLSGKCITL